MSKRRVRHVHAKQDEWIRVHRDKPGGGGGDDGCATMFGVLLFLLFLGSCMGF